MDIHKNARLTLRSREALVETVIRGLGFSRAAASFRVTPKTAAKWVRRYQSAGVAGLCDRSSRPHRSPRATSSSHVGLVIELRRQHRPAYQIAQSTGLSPATVSRILRRARLSRWRDLHPRPPAVRYEHPFPGDLLHLDIKGMTRFQQVSWRGDGRRRGQQKHPGWEALHVAVDDHSRLAFTRILPDQKTHTTIAFLRDAVDFFARHGIIVHALLTDNGSSYRSHLFRQACFEMGPNTAALARTRHKPTAKRNASSRPLCANGPIPLTGPTPTYATWPSLLGPTTTTTPVLMVAFTTSRPSAAPNQVQPLDHLQAPRFDATVL